MIMMVLKSNSQVKSEYIHKLLFGFIETWLLIFYFLFFYFFYFFFIFFNFYFYFILFFLVFILWIDEIERIDRPENFLKNFKLFLNFF